MADSIRSSCIMRTALMVIVRIRICAGRSGILEVRFSSTKRSRFVLGISGFFEGSVFVLDSLRVNVASRTVELEFRNSVHFGFGFKIVT